MNCLKEKEADKAKIRAINKVSDSYAAKEAALSDGQDMAEALLEAETRLGVLLEGIDKKQSYEGLTSTGGRKPILPQGISHKESHQAQTIANYPEVVEELNLDN